MTDLELDVWDAWLRERQEHLEETLSNISPSEEPCLPTPQSGWKISPTERRRERKSSV